MSSTAEVCAIVVAGAQNIVEIADYRFYAA
jgi:hypothetical protein